MSTDLTETSIPYKRQPSDGSSLDSSDPGLAPRASSSSCTWRHHVWNGLNTINHCLIAIVCFTTCWLAYTSVPFRLFELHVFFSTIGYQLLMAQTLLALSGDNSWTRLFSPRTRRLLHALLGVLGVGFATAGFAIIIRSRILAGKTHFKNPHAILGLAAQVLIVPTALNGPVALAWTWLRPRTRVPVYLRSYHSFTAMACFILGMTALCLGYQKKWFKNKTSPEFITCFIVFTSITMVLTLKTPLYSFCRMMMDRFFRKD